MSNPFFPPPFFSNECVPLVLTVRSMGAGLALSPEELGGGGDSQRRKKRLSSRSFERLGGTQVGVLLSFVLSSNGPEIKEDTLCFFVFDIFLYCTPFLIRCYPQESNPLFTILISTHWGLYNSFLFSVCEQMRALFLCSAAFAADSTASVTDSHLSLLLQIKAQSCRKSGLHGVLSSKLSSDVARLKQKSQAKKNLSGTGSGDKEVSPSSSNLKYGHKSQGTSKAESRRESGGQSDTGRY